MSKRSVELVDVGWPEVLSKVAEHQHHVLIHARHSLALIVKVRSLPDSRLFGVESLFFSHQPKFSDVRLV